MIVRFFGKELVMDENIEGLVSEMVFDVVLIRYGCLVSADVVSISIGIV